MNRFDLKLLAIAALACAPAFAQAPAAPAAPAAKDVAVPTAAEAKKVMEYIQNGKDKGPLLVDLVACTKVDTAKDSPTKNECIEPVTGPVKKGTTVHAWTTWLVPEGGNYEDVVIQFLLDGQVRTTADVKLTYGNRRTWRASNMSKPGKWDIKVLRGGTELGTASVTVQ